MIGEYVIVRTRESGVTCGVLKTLTPQPGGLACAVLAEASRIHYWKDANTLMEVSLRGPGIARISEPVSQIMIFGVCEVLLCEKKAEKNLRNHRWNKPHESSDSHRQATKQPG